MKALEILSFSILGVLLWTTLSGASFEKAEMRDFVSFTKEVQPVFKENCAGCHQNKGLADITTYTTAYPLRNEIVRRVYENRSMPKHGPFLKESDRELVKLWVDTGAKK